MQITIPKMKRVDTRASIRTKYIGPTNFQGTRISVTDDEYGSKRRRLVFDRDYSMDVAENHRDAAQKWIDKFIAMDAEVDGPGLGFNGDYFWTWRN